MQIVIIGSGNVAQVLAKIFVQAGHSILQMVARNEQTLGEFCKPLEIPYTTDWNDLKESADVYVIAVADRAIEEVLDQLGKRDLFMVHTAGSVSERILEKSTTRTGIFYPLQSIKKENPALPDLSLLIHAKQSEDLVLLKSLAHSISQKVMIADDEQRANYHLAAVIANNFSNHLYTLANDFCVAHQLDFRVLIPMLKEQVDRLESQSPEQVQTGPAIRRDEKTIQKHLSKLSGEIKELYQWFTQSIQKRY